jgi:small subunit ribosomal protein S10
MQKIRIKIKGYDPKVVDNASLQIIDAAVRSGAKAIGPIPLPTRKSLFTVNRSPHIDSKSKEQFEMRVHKRLIEIMDPNSQTIDMLTHLQLAAGVGVEIK